MGLTVTQLAYAFGGSNPSLPTSVRYVIDSRSLTYCGSSSVDRALAFQAKGRGFEPRLPLQRSKASTPYESGLFCWSERGEVMNPFATFVLGQSATNSVI